MSNEFDIVQLTMMKQKQPMIVPSKKRKCRVIEDVHTRKTE